MMRAGVAVRPRAKINMMRAGLRGYIE